MSTYQRLDYRDYSASVLLYGVESGIRVNWRAMQRERKELKRLAADGKDEWAHRYHNHWMMIHKVALCELLDIRRQAR